MADPQAGSVTEILKIDARPIGVEAERIQRCATTAKKQGGHKLLERPPAEALGVDVEARRGRPEAAPPRRQDGRAYGVPRRQEEDDVAEQFVGKAADPVLEVHPLCALAAGSAHHRLAFLVDSRAFSRTGGVPCAKHQPRLQKYTLADAWEGVIVHQQRKEGRRIKMIPRNRLELEGIPPGIGEDGSEAEASDERTGS